MSDENTSGPGEATPEGTITPSEEAPPTAPTDPVGETIGVLFLNAEGTGFAGETRVPKGSTVGQFFKEQMKGREAREFKIKVNRDIAKEGDILRDGDKVSVTPEKVGGSY